jgi:hypothetical protein
MHDPEAWSDEYSDFRESVQLSYENDFLDKLWRDISDAKSCTFLYREHANTLRQIISKGGDNKNRASILLQDLILNQTMPISELEALTWKKVGDTWVEVDSYTGEPFPDIETEVGRYAEAHSIGGQVARKIPHPDNSLVKAISRAYPPELAEKAVKALGYQDSPSEEVWFMNDEDEIPSVPLWQEENLMLKPDYADLAELRFETQPMLNSIKNLAIKMARKYNNDQLKIRNMVSTSVEADELIYWAIWRARTCEVQDLYIILASAVWLDERLDEIPVEIYGNLGNFADLFGDDVLDQVIDAGWHPQTTSDERIIAFAERFEDEIVSTFEKDSKSIPHTQSYARGVLNGVAQGKTDLNGSGYANWRWEKSKIGSISYNATLTIEESLGTPKGEAIKKAWRSFWNAGRITKVTSKGLVIKADATGKEYLCNWGLSKWKLARKEIYLDSQDKVRLNKILSDNHWGGSLIGELNG